MSEAMDAGAPRRRRVWRSPLLHFVLIGAALFAFDALRRGDAAGPVIRLDAEDVAVIEAEWAQRMGRPPDRETLEALVAARVDDELMLAEARALGWHRDDAIVQRRLLRNQRFLAPQDPASDAELLERAWSQGMDRSDLVVRRRLLERMRLLVMGTARSPAPDDATLEARLRRDAARYRRPARIRLSHVFLSRDRRGGSLARDAGTLLRRLREEGLGPDEGVDLGDPFLLPRHLPTSAEDQLARQLGADFAAGAMAAPVGGWSQPVSSAYGLHLLWVHERTPARDPALAEVRRAVEADELREREQRALRRYLDALRARAVVEVTWPDRGGDGGAASGRPAGELRGEPSQGS